MRKALLFTAVLAALGLFSTTEVQAQNFAGGYLGYNLDNEEMFVGIEGRFAAPGPYTLSLNPGVETYFIENVTLLQLNLNGIVDIGSQYATTFVPYVGAGVGLTYTSVEVFDDNVSDTALKINALGGIRLLPASALQPFVQARLSFLDGSTLALQAGILFRFGA